jgi:hypothetical protein
LRAEAREPLLSLLLPLSINLERIFARRFSFLKSTQTAVLFFRLFRRIFPKGRMEIIGTRVELE